MNTMLRSLLILALLFSPFMGTDSFASSFIFSDFSDTSTLSLNESATTTTTADGDVLRLATSLGGTGSAFTLDTFAITSFHTSFAFRITEPSGAPDVSGSVGGDGFAFVIQAQSSDSVGGGGGFL